MFTQYRAPDGAQLHRLFGATRFPEGTGATVRLGTVAPVLCRNGTATPEFGKPELVPAYFGQPVASSLGRRTPHLNHVARIEHISKHSALRTGWSPGQHCIIPACWINVADWRSGVPVPAQLGRVDNLPMGLAGIWIQIKTIDEQRVLYFSVLTVDSRVNSLASHLAANRQSARMPVILPERMFEHWLASSTAVNALPSMQMSAERLTLRTEVESYRTELGVLEQALEKEGWRPSLP